MPTNLYGPGDNFHPENSHVIPALMRRFHEAVQAGAAEVVIWGSGTPMREFLHVDDMAAASVLVMQLPDDVLSRAHPAHAQPHQRGHRRGLHASASWPRRSPGSPASPARWSATAASPTARRAS